MILMTPLNGAIIGAGSVVWLLASALVAVGTAEWYFTRGIWRVLLGVFCFFAWPLVLLCWWGRMLLYGWD